MFWLSERSGAGWPEAHHPLPGSLAWTQDPALEACWTRLWSLSMQDISACRGGSLPTQPAPRPLCGAGCLDSGRCLGQRPVLGRSWEWPGSRWLPEGVFRAGSGSRGSGQLGLQTQAAPPLPGPGQVSDALS